MATSTPPRPIRTREAVESVVIRFAGDSGDGMQVTGSQFTVETALAGNDLATFPDFPAEIRAPAGTTFGVSAFQIRFGTADVLTAGDAMDVLVAMNPAALQVELRDLKPSGTIVVDTGAFAERPDIAAANVAALNAGHAFGETAEMAEHVVGYTVAPAHFTPGVYRTVSGTEALAWGLIAGMRAAGLSRMIFSGYPITPASALLHTLANLKAFGVLTFQAEDEIAAIGAAIGAAYAGALGVTSSSGPGIALKTEMLGLAIATELPIVLVDSQRAGPSTGMPTKTEQSDLFQAVLGRNADSPLAVIAAASAGDCFEVAIEAVRLATKYMTPVILLTDGYLAHAAEPWLIPDVDALPGFPVTFRTDPEGFHPYVRDAKTLARAWAVPGTPGLAHRIGGIEKSYTTGHISYDPDNHQQMTDVRAAKVAGVAADIPEQGVALGNPSGALAVVGWGSTYGPIHQAVKQARADGLDVSHVHLRYVSPFPRNLGELLRGYGRVLVPEMNNGQLVQLLRAAYLLPVEGLSQVTGKPFKVATILEAIRA